MLTQMVYTFIFFASSMLFCILGNEYAECNDDFHDPPLAPPIISVLELSLCITIYFGYCALLIYKFKVYGIAGIAAALLVHFLFLRSAKRRKQFVYWCISTLGGWSLIYILLYLFEIKVEK